MTIWDLIHNLISKKLWLKIVGNMYTLLSMVVVHPV